MENSNYILVLSLSFALFLSLTHTFLLIPQPITVPIINV